MTHDIKRLRAGTDLEIGAAGQLASEADMQALLKAAELRLAAERAWVDARLARLESVAEAAGAFDDSLDGVRMRAPKLDLALVEEKALALRAALARLEGVE